MKEGICFSDRITGWTGQGRSAKSEEVGDNRLWTMVYGPWSILSENLTKRRVQKRSRPLKTAQNLLTQQVGRDIVDSAGILEIQVL